MCQQEVEMEKIIKSFDKLGVSGVFIAALSCTACFPALGALAATLGLGFLSPLEGIAINMLLPIFAAIALAVNLYGWIRHLKFLAWNTFSTWPNCSTAYALSSLAIWLEYVPILCSIGVDVICINS